MSDLHIIVLITLSGAAGGMAYSMANDGCYHVKIPFSGVDVNTGFFGHAFVGSLAALVAIPFAEYLLKLDLGSSSVPKLFSTYQITTYVIAIGIVGGFSGLRLIEGMSIAVLKRLQKETAQTLKEVEKSVEASAENKVEIASLRRISSYEDDYNQAKDRLRESLYEEAIINIDSAINTLPTAKAWILKARIFRGKEKYTLALDALQKAAEIGCENTLDESVLYWNRACYKALLNGESDISAILEDVKRSIELHPPYRKDVPTEKDFEPVKDNPEFKASFNNKEN